MASINLTGVLRDSTGEFAHLNKIRFTHTTTTGQTLKGFRSVHVIAENGYYDIDVEYGNVFIESQDALNRVWIDQGTLTINSDTPANDLPSLLGITTPATDADLLVFQSLVADSETARDESVAAKDEIESKLTSLIPSSSGFNSLQEAIDSVTASLNPELITNYDYSPTDTITDKSNAVLIGNGTVDGYNYDSNFYRRRVIDQLAGTGIAAVDTRMNLDLTLDNVTIVLVGDSLTTHYSNTISSATSISKYLVDKLRNDNPSIDINFVNRGIGGETYASLNGFPFTLNQDEYPWYTDTEVEWLDYVALENPDYVAVSMGMNDLGSFDPVTFREVLSKIEAMGAKPILITNMVPNLSPNEVFYAYGTYAGQEFRDRVAGYVRTYANKNDIPLIDINRTFNMVRDGRDILDTYFVQNSWVRNSEGLEFIASEDQSCRDFSMAMLLEDGCFDTGVIMQMFDSGVVSDNIVNIDNQNGLLRFRFYGGDGTGTSYTAETTDIPTPTGASVVEFTLVGSVFTFRVLNANRASSPGIQPYSWNIIRYGGIFRPAVYYPGLVTGPVLQVQYSYGVEKALKPMITDRGMYGDVDDSANRFREGGNSINHPASRGIAAVYGEHFKRQNYKFNMVPTTVKNGDESYTLYPDGKLEMIGKVTLADGVTSRRGSVFSSGNGVWAFPYANATEINSVNVHATDGNVWTSGTAPSLTSVTGKAWCYISYAVPIDLMMSAKGRWK